MKRKIDKEHRRAWWRSYLNKIAKNNPAANIVIMNIIQHRELEHEILDRLRLNKNGRILGWLRGG